MDFRPHALGPRHALTVLFNALLIFSGGCVAVSLTCGLGPACLHGLARLVDRVLTAESSPFSSTIQSADRAAKVSNVVQYKLPFIQGNTSCSGWHSGVLLALTSLVENAVQICTPVIVAARRVNPTQYTVVMSFDGVAAL